MGRARHALLLSLLSLASLAPLGAQEPPPGTIPGGNPPSPASPPGSVRTVDWKEGVPIPVRVPVSSPERPLMTTISFPEEGIETAVTGWNEGDLTAVAKRGLLFMKADKRFKTTLPSALNVKDSETRAGREAESGPGTQKNRVSMESWIDPRRKYGPHRGATSPNNHFRKYSQLPFSLALAD